MLAKVFVCLSMGIVMMVEADNYTTNNPLFDGMLPFFKMTNNFLGVVQPSSKGTVVDVILGGQNMTAIEKEDLTSKMQTDYSDVLKHYIGYAACLAAGILFIIVMFIGGWIICCCRCCCKKCGGKPGRRRRNDKWKRRCCGLLLFCTASIMLAGCVCSFLANELMRRQTATGDRNMATAALQSSMADVSSFISDSTDNFVDKITQVFGDLQATINQFSDLPKQTRDAVAQFANVDGVTDDGMELGAVVERLNTTLTQISTLTTSLQQSSSELQQNLTAIQSDLNQTCSSLAGACGASLEASINNLHMDADFSHVDSVGNELDSISGVADANLTAMILQGLLDFNSMTDQVASSTEGIIESVNQSMAAAQYQIDYVRDNTKQELQNVLTQINDFSQQVSSYQSQIYQYGNYRYYACIGLCSVILLVIFFLYIGLCVGVCTKSREEAASSCHRGVGANLLVAGTVFAFLFCWLLMLVVILTFFVGGFVQTEACRYLVDLKSSPLLPQLQGNLKGVLPKGAAVDISKSVQSCANNDGLGTVINLDSIYNVSHVLDPNTYGFYQRMAYMNNITVNFTDINLVSNETMQQLEALRDSGIDHINLTSYDAQLTRNLTAIDLISLANQIDAKANETTNSAAADKLHADAHSLRLLYYNTVVPMMNTTSQLASAIRDLRSEQAEYSGQISNSTQHLMDSLQAVNDNVHANGTVAVRQFVSNVTASVYGQLSDMATNLKNWVLQDFAPCGKLYSAMTGCIDIVCVNVLYPLNAYWFGIGWCLFFYIPSVIMALFLATVYRRGEYEDDSDKDMDDPFNQPQVNSRATTSQQMHTNGAYVNDFHATNNNRISPSDQVTYNEPPPDYGDHFTAKSNHADTGDHHFNGYTSQPPHYQH